MTTMTAETLDRRRGAGELDLRGLGLRVRGLLALWLMIQGAFGQSPGPEAGTQTADPRLTVPLEVVAADAYIVLQVDFDSPAEAPAGTNLTDAGVDLTGKAPADVAVRLEGLGGSPPRCRLRIDADADGDLDEEVPLVLARGDSVSVEVRPKRAGGASRTYGVELSGSEQSEGIAWWPLYRAEGMASVDGSDYRVGIQDLTCDGAFDLVDLKQGTALGVDLDGDGTFRGFMEYFNLSQVVSLGSRRFTIEDVSAERLVLQPATVEIAAVGAPVPRHDLQTIDAGVVALSGARDRPLLVEFWASWCNSCVQRMPQVKELAGERAIDIVYVSIDDEGAGVEKAREIASKHGIEPGSLVMRGMGLRDEAFCVFASIPVEEAMTRSDGTKWVWKRRAGVAVPLLALIDRHGVLRYVGSGGKDLEELKTALEAVEGG